MSALRLGKRRQVSMATCVLTTVLTACCRAIRHPCGEDGLLHTVARRRPVIGKLFLDLKRNGSVRILVAVAPAQLIFFEHPPSFFPAWCGLERIVNGLFALGYLFGLLLAQFSGPAEETFLEGAAMVEGQDI